ncbi:MAG: hypothetical protein NXI35_21785 [bacterium]|nr:hypothetical protein [bacterium]
MTDEPPALSPELRTMLEAYRGETTMPADAKARVQQRLDAPAGGRPIWLWAGIAAAAAAVLIWGAVSSTRALQSKPEASPGSQAAMQATASGGETASVTPDAAPTHETKRAKPDPVSPPEPEPEPEPEPDAAREQPRRDRYPAPKSAPEPNPAPAASRLGAENRLIAKIWEHLRAKRYAQAKATLHEHATSFPKGVLAPERRALEVIVSCLTDPASAAGKANAYSSSGHTTLLSKVRAACSEEKTTPQ